MTPQSLVNLVKHLVLLGHLLLVPRESDQTIVLAILLQVAGLN
ncbi:hypothetical protein OIU79_024014 [Salix purpurea]|uniref:Uncharacterized protein n=1 Tax=Salix purpurea TaxID=77065 RepID=A0A9Q0WA27_SALPP|nr:hypothetical protein OIU79_024014 [Salix purpurea]